MSTPPSGGISRTERSGGLDAGDLEASEGMSTTTPVELATFGAVPQRQRGRLERTPASKEKTVSVAEGVGTAMRRVLGETKTVRVAVYDVLRQEVGGSSTGRCLPGNPGHCASGK